MGSTCVLKWLYSPETFSSMEKWKTPVTETTCASSTATTPLEATSRCVCVKCYSIGLCLDSVLCLYLLILCVYVSATFSLKVTVSAIICVTLSILQS